MRPFVPYMLTMSEEERLPGKKLHLSEVVHFRKECQHINVHTNRIEEVNEMKDEYRWCRNCMSIEARF